MKMLVNKICYLWGAWKGFIKLNKCRSGRIDSKEYWRRRYARGGGSGDGSYNELAEFKAGVLNGFVRENDIRSVIEYGCGDGNQLRLAEYPVYIGFDVSPLAILRCKTIFANDKTKSFKLMDEYAGESAELTLSLDVIFHLIEDNVFYEYMTRLFNSSQRYVIIYSSNTDDNSINLARHVRHRKFTDWVEKEQPQWKMIKHIENIYPYTGDNKRGSMSDFYIYKKEIT